MKLCRFESAMGETLTGCLEPAEPGMARVLEGGAGTPYRETARVVKVERLLAPVTPRVVYALGLNYGKHARETGIAAPSAPLVFMKAPTSVIGPGETILLPLAGPDQVDYEAELAVVIGKAGKNISRADALDHILGYTCANDVSARDWQMDKARGQQGQWTRGKGFDTFCPLGPFLVTKDEIGNPHGLRICTRLNGQVVQDARTDQLIFDIPSLVSFLSQSVTLLPGTVILTGTPEGVGFTRQPPLFLRHGDTVEVQIEQIGILSNPVERETP
jgi:2-keto-4-pentenoate hydratase/2-oxohepta-3-ene-1,7-dioic acid hydratase in catechol pathway